MKDEAQERFDYLFKIVIIGDANVGKTNIISRLVRDEFIEHSKSTIGVDFATKTFKFGSSSIKVQLWDTAGQERYHALISAYYRGSSGAVIVYDVTNKPSFEHSYTSWLNNLESSTKESIPKMLLGNKIDLRDQVEVSRADGERAALERNMAFFETSALLGDNIHIAFESFIKKIFEKETTKEIASSKKLLDESKVKRSNLAAKSKRKSRCC
ncbi:small GTP-binding protein domain protein [Vittaforma corneae ATCC 50505]|uniref:Small GTP-binding protein domain protein n=1 Tax=Vittaforma corneae (strain ATCC 50505) TaxID=993615 RepID=L2GNC2_VITCO|nr:small GTP-binding protein domain protein [Vittaforma corneae ATCC 50505]ELA42398.1 small GTP-binding protein domain protein [Vittaforma corneae ATCC 50505]